MELGEKNSEQEDLLHLSADTNTYEKEKQEIDLTNENDIST